MGQPKLSLLLGDRPILHWTIASLRDAGASPVVVVVAPHVRELVEVAKSAGAVAILLATETPDMRATIEAGLEWFEASRNPTTADAWLLCPADHPVLDPPSVQALIAARDNDPVHSIFVPTFEGRRGHPALIGWGHVGGIRELPPNTGINVYLRRQASVIREVPVPSATILVDLDTPADYERLKARLGPATGTAYPT
jgi:molybdenum cofactor cytidylyltransferase